MKMSNNHRWVRIPTIDIFAKLLETPDVVIADLLTYTHVTDSDNFHDIIRYQDDGLKIGLIDPNLTKVGIERKKYLEPYILIACACEVKVNNKFFHPTAMTWATSTLAAEKFDLSKPSGFYLLQESKIKVNEIPITEVPPDGLVIYNGCEAKLVEHPRGVYHLLGYCREFNIPKLIALGLTDFKSMTRLDFQVTGWQPLPLDIQSEAGFEETLRHFKETFVSVSGCTPDEYYDKQNEGV